MCGSQETVTGSTLNGKKEYLNAEVGDKDKWDFLNFSNAWTPCETLPPPQGDPGNGKDGVFFSHVSLLLRSHKKHCLFRSRIDKVLFGKKASCYFVHTK